MSRENRTAQIASAAGGDPAVSTDRTDWETRQRAVYAPDFDLHDWIAAACEKSRVPFAVSDPVALSKLRVLTRTSS